MAETTKGSDIFQVVNKYLGKINLPWNICLSIFTDGTRAMTGCIKGFLASVEAKNPKIIFTHCFLRRETFITQALPVHVRDELNQAVKVINIKRSSLRTLVPIYSDVAMLVCTRIRNLVAFFVSLFDAYRFAYF